MKELDLRSFFMVLLQNLRLIVAVAVAMAVLFGVATGLLTEDSYSSRCSFYIMNISKESSDGSYTGISANGLDTSQKLVSECIVMIKSNRVMNEVAEKVNARGFNTTAAAVRASLSLTAVEDTALMRVVSTTKNPKLSKAICEEVQANVPSIVSKAMADLVSIAPFDIPDDAAKNAPMLLRNSILGGVFGMLLICGMIMIRYLMDTTIKDEKDLKNRFNVNVLGVVLDTGTIERNNKDAANTKKGGDQ